MQQIAEWLAKIGLERYAPAFVDNDIDVSVLRYLTDADLEKIGVSLGHRRKLLAAIAELGGGAATPAQPLPNQINKKRPSVVGPPRSRGATSSTDSREIFPVLPKKPLFCKNKLPLFWRSSRCPVWQVTRVFRQPAGDKNGWSS
jgi:SAM domain (Sterile alpha motif)